MRLSSICISSRSLRSRAPSGSSRSRTRGRLTSARASATRCRWPPESWPGLRLLVAVEADHPQRLARRAGRARPSATLRTISPYATLSPHGHVREQRVVLEDGVDVALERRQARDVLRRGGGPGPRSAARSPRSSAASSSCPSPDGPSIEKNSPSAISRSMPSTAATSPKRLLDALEADGGCTDGREPCGPVGGVVEVRGRAGHAVRAPVVTLGRIGNPATVGLPFGREVGAR